MTDGLWSLALLGSILHPRPGVEAWLLTDALLENSQPVLRDLTPTQVLDRGLGRRFEAVIRQPHRSTPRWLQHQYRYRRSL